MTLQIRNTIELNSPVFNPILPSEMVHKIFSYLQASQLAEMTRQAYRVKGLIGLLQLIGGMDRFTKDVITICRKYDPYDASPDLISAHQQDIKGTFLALRTTSQVSFEKSCVDLIKKVVVFSRKFLPKQISKLPDDEFRDLFEKGYDSKSQSILRTICSSDRLEDLNPHQIKLSLFFVAQYGDLKSFQKIQTCSHFQELEAEQLCISFRIAAKNQHLNILRSFLENPRYSIIGDVGFENYLILACMKGRAELILELIRHPRFLKLLNAELVFYLGFLVDSVEIIEYLSALELNLKLPAYFLENLSYLALSKANKGLVNALIKCKNFSPDLRENFIPWLDNQVSQMELLVYCNQAIPLVYKYFAKAFKGCCKRGESGLVSVMMTHELFNHMSSIDRVDSFLLSVQSKQIEIVQLLLPVWKNTIEILGKALVIASKQNDVAIVKEIVLSDAYNRISKSEIIEALLESALFRHHAIIDTLINHPRFVELNDDDLAYILCEIVELDAVSIIQKISNSINFVKIPSSLLNSIFASCSSLGHFNMARCLLESLRGKEISTAHLSASLVFASNNNSVSYLDFLISHPRFSEIDRITLDHAILKAMEEGNLDVIKRFMTSLIHLYRDDSIKFFLSESKKLPFFFIVEFFESLLKPELTYPE